MWARRHFAWILWLAAAVYPLLWMFYAWRPLETVRALWAAERLLVLAPWAILALFTLLLMASPAWGERFRTFRRALWARLTLHRHEIEELIQLEKEMQNHYYAHKLGEAYLRRYLIPEAEAAFRRAASRDINVAATLYHWGRCLLRLGQHEDGLEVLRRAHALDPTLEMGSVSLELARAHLATGGLEEGIARTREFLDRARDHPEGHELLAQLLERQGDRAGARRELETVLAILARAPAYSRREYKFLRRRTRRKLRRLPAGTTASHPSN
jgi:tetratricopeptide (TPR) repeat protein